PILDRAHGDRNVRSEQALSLIAAKGVARRAKHAVAHRCVRAEPLVHAGPRVRGKGPSSRTRNAFLIERPYWSGTSEAKLLLHRLGERRVPASLWVGKVVVTHVR